MTIIQPALEGMNDIQSGIDKENMTRPPEQSPDQARIAEIQHKLYVLTLIRMGVSGLGTVAGWYYANKTGGGFWRYLGFGFIGGASAGAIAFMATIPAYSELDKELKGLQ
jgi:hypothetical protein